MKISFECTCGEEIDDFTRGDGDINTRMRCDECGTVHAVTISALTKPSP